MGFEAPMHVPYRDLTPELTKARHGEGNRAWSAGAGAGVLATRLAVVPFILRKLRALAPKATATLDWHVPPGRPDQLFLFEAFVSGAAKGADHNDDARIAADAFLMACSDLPGANLIGAEDCFSLLGAALLRTGWSTDLRLLSAPALVIGGATWRAESQTRCAIGKSGRH